MASRRETRDGGTAGAQSDSCDDGCKVKRAAASTNAAAFLGDPTVWTLRIDGRVINCRTFLMLKARSSCWTNRTPASANHRCGSVQKVSGSTPS